MYVNSYPNDAFSIMVKIVVFLLPGTGHNHGLPGSEHVQIRIFLEKTKVFHCKIMANFSLKCQTRILELNYFKFRKGNSQSENS